MNMSGNTILVTGGGSGIGKGLAVALHKAGNKVIVAGRRADALRAVVAENPGMAFEVLDIADADAIPGFAARVTAAHPGLNVVFNNAGVMLAEDMVADSVDLASAEATIATNLLGPIRLGAALLPHLRARPDATIINVTSGLAFVPLAFTPTYSATKAALHSYSQSLRHQLRGTSIKVIELAPPLVATDLMPGNSVNPNAMPLDDFIAECMALLSADPEATDIYVERVQNLRRAEERGIYAAVFSALNPA